MKGEAWFLWIPLTPGLGGGYELVRPPRASGTHFGNTRGHVISEWEELELLFS